MKDLMRFVVRAVLVGFVIWLTVAMLGDCSGFPKVVVSVGGSSAGSSSRGGASAVGGSSLLGGSAAVGGAVAVVSFPACRDATFGAQPVTKHPLQRRFRGSMKSRQLASYVSSQSNADRFWLTSIVGSLDQQGNSCTGNALVDGRLRAPFSVVTLPLPWSNYTDADSFEPLALDVYHRATLIDQWPEVFPPDDSGSDSFSTMTVAVGLGYYKTFSELTELSAIQTALLSGPCVFDSDWTDEMFEVERCGQIHVKGVPSGGHAWGLVGNDVKKKLFWGWTSWRGFALFVGKASGYFSISYGDAAKLLLDGGRVYCPR